MAAPTFTLTAGDGLASRIGVTRQELAGVKVIFTSNVRRGALVSVDDGAELIDRVVVYLDEDGKLNGDTGITLIADDGSLNLSEPLEWQASFDGARSQGFSRSITSFWFDAPTDGASINLADVVPPPGQTSNRGPAAPRLVGGSFNEDDDLVLENADESLLSPIMVPSGVLAFVDNGDGTWSVG